MTFPDLVVSLYGRLSAYRTPLLVCVLVVLTASALLLARLDLREDAEALLPDDDSGLAQDFRLLQKAPLARKVLIDVESRSEEGAKDLPAVGEALAAALDPTQFDRVMTGPHVGLGLSFLGRLLDILPGLATPEDLADIEAGLTPEAVRTSLEKARRILVSPEGLGLKDVVRRDPLDLKRLILRKLASINMARNLRPREGHFLSQDGRHMLLIAEVAGAMTDAQTAQETMHSFEMAVTKTVPEGFAATFVGGPRYTRANVQAIRSDLGVVFACSTFALAALLLIFMRNRGGLVVFLLPFSVLPPAAVLTNWLAGGISGITLGFGSVLMGIAIDYAIYVYFSLRGAGDPATALAQVAKPVLYGALTSMAAFAALLFSSMPCIRQLALFSILGLGISLLLSLFVLPHLLSTDTASRPARDNARAQKSMPGRSNQLVMKVVWLILALIGVWWGGQARFNGDLRGLSVAPPGMVEDEARLRKVWGAMREVGMIFASGSDLETALSETASVKAKIDASPAWTGSISLAPLLPPQSKQREAVLAWRRLWSQERLAALSQALRQGGDLGFSATAFEPFLAWLSREPKPVTEQTLRDMGLGDILDMLLVRNLQGVQVLTMVPDDPAAMASLGELGAGVRAVSQTRFRQELTQLMRADFVRYTSLAVVANLVLLFWLFRNMRRTLLTMMPLAGGLAFLFGVFGVLGMELNLFGIAAIPLVIGIGVDYGIFMVCCGTCTAQTRRAVLVAGLSTLSGFGVLALARHPALHSIGLTVLLGIGAAVVSTLVFLPAFAGGRR